MTLPLSPNGRRYGYLKDPIDARDFGVARFLKAPVPIPPASSLEQWLGPAKDQGPLGACTAFAGCGMLEFLFRKYDFNYMGDLSEFAPVLSPMYLYYKERQLDGVPANIDSGSYGRTACRAMQQFGVCAETEDPYSPKDFAATPSEEMDSEAATMKSGAYHRLVNVDDMKHCIASGYCFVVGFDVKESFESQTGGSGIYHPSGQSLGGHEVLFYGYDDNEQGGCFKVRNSWGTNWGKSGNFLFPYEVAASSILYDAWIQHLGHAWK